MLIIAFYLLQTPLSVIQGGKSFNSGKPISRNSFLYTFDDPGMFCVASQGAPGFCGTVSVLSDGKFRLNLLSCTKIFLSYAQ